MTNRPECAEEDQDHDRALQAPTIRRLEADVAERRERVEVLEDKSKR